MQVDNHLLRSRCVAGATFAAWLLFQVNSGWAQTAPTAPPASTPVVGTSDWDQWKNNCALSNDFRKKFFSCATSTFRSRPFHFVAHSVVPGSGVGGGGRYAPDLNQRSGAQNQLQATGVFTIRKFWFTELRFSSQRTID